MHPFINKATEAIYAAGRVILQHLDRIDLITGKMRSNRRVDHLAENTIVNMLTEAYPNHQIANGEDAPIQKDSEFVWVVDSLNGSINFLRGMPNFSISIACYHFGKIQHGLIFDPVRDELFSASLNQGSALNRHRIRVSTRDSLNQALVALAIAEESDSATYLDINAIQRLCAGLRASGTPALDLAYVAAGRLDVVLGIGLEQRGIAAGSLIVQEAGGKVLGFNPEQDNSEQDNLEQGLVIAGNFKQVGHLSTVIDKR